MKRKDITFKQELFCREYIRCKGNATEAVKRIYADVATDGARAVAGCRLLRKANIRRRIRVILEDSEFSLKNLSLHLKQGLEAKKPLLINGKMIFVDDNMAQIEAVKLGFKLYGVFRIK